MNTRKISSRLRAATLLSEGVAMRYIRLLAGALALGWIGLAAPAWSQDLSPVVNLVEAVANCCQFDFGHSPPDSAYSGSFCTNDDPVICMELSYGTPGIGPCNTSTGKCVAELPTCCEFPGLLGSGTSFCTNMHPLLGTQRCSAAYGQTHIGTCNGTTGKCDTP